MNGKVKVLVKGHGGICGYGVGFHLSIPSLSLERSLDSLEDGGTVIDLTAMNDENLIKFSVHGPMLDVSLGPDEIN